jgi:hypothetical protein
MSFECHVTVSNPNEEICEEYAKLYEWKTSKIERDPLLGDKTFFYFTCHGKEYDSVFSKMKQCVEDLQMLGLKCVREKIEHIIHDVRF